MIMLQPSIRATYQIRRIQGCTRRQALGDALGYWWRRLKLPWR